MAPPNKQNPPPFRDVLARRGTTAKPPPPFGGIPLIRGTTATNSLLRRDQGGGSIPDREARRPRRGRAFCPPDKGGSRGVFFPTGKQWDSPEQTKPSPFSGRTRPKGDNGKTPSPLRGYPPYQGDNSKNLPPLSGRTRLIRRTTANTPLIRGTTALPPPKKQPLSLLDLLRYQGGNRLFAYYYDYPDYPDHPYHQWEFFAEK